MAVSQDARTFFVSDGYCNQRVIQYAIRSITSNGHHSVVKVMSFGASNIPNANQPRSGGWNPTVYNFNIPHALTLIESMNLVCVADRENGLVQCFNMKTGVFEFTIPAISSFNGKIYSVHSSGTTLAILGGPQSSSKSKLFLYDLKTHQSTEAVIEGAPVTNPHDVAISEDAQEVVVANLNNPIGVWLFKNPERIGKAIVEEVRMDTQDREPQKYLLPKSAQAPESGSLWKTFGLIVVFVTGMAMIILYVRRRRKKNDGFVPLNTKDDDEL